MNNTGNKYNCLKRITYSSPLKSRSKVTPYSVIKIWYTLWDKLGDMYPLWMEDLIHIVGQTGWYVLSMDGRFDTHCGTNWVICTLYGWKIWYTLWDKLGDMYSLWMEDLIHIVGQTGWYVLSMDGRFDTHCGTNWVICTLYGWKICQGVIIPKAASNVLADRWYHTSTGTNNFNGFGFAVWTDPGNSIRYRTLTLALRLAL